MCRDGKLKDRDMRVDLGKQLKFPEESAIASLRPKYLALIPSLKASGPNRAERGLSGGKSTRLGNISPSSLRGVGKPHQWSWVGKASLDTHSGVHDTQESAHWSLHLGLD